MWHKIKKSLIEQSVDIGIISGQLVNDNEQLLPHLLDQIDIEFIIKALQDIGVNTYTSTEQNQDIIYVNNYFIIGKNGDAYSVNPFSAVKTFDIYNKAKELGVVVTKIGFLDKNHNILKDSNKSTGTKLTTTADQKALHNIFSKASKNQVSDIHLLPRNKSHIAILFEQFGLVIESGIDDIEIRNYPSFANFLATMADDNGGCYRHFLEKQIDYKKSGLNLEIRLQRNPLVQKFDDGQPVPEFILRVHNKKSKTSFKSLDDIGLLSYQAQLIANVVKNNSGIVIIAGPTGSGKTTVLHAALDAATEVANGLRLAKTFEDPVEIRTTKLGITQTNINKKAGVTYESAIPAILRSKKSVALIGETRSAETAKGIFELDMVGHLVLTTLHAKTTVAIIDRLREFGINSRHIADSVSLMVSTRLVKKVCSECSTMLEVEQINKLNDERRAENQSDYYTIKSKYKSNKGISLTDRIAIVNNKGCKCCLNGYHGRVLVAETVRVDNTLKDLIIADASNQTLIQQVEKHGNKNIWDHGFYLLKKGLTTLEALELVMPNYSDFGNNYSSDEFDKT